MMVPSLCGFKQFDGLDGYKENIKNIKFTMGIMSVPFSPSFWHYYSHQWSYISFIYFIRTTSRI